MLIASNRESPACAVNAMLNRNPIAFFMFGPGYNGQGLGPVAETRVNSKAKWTIGPFTVLNVGFYPMPRLPKKRQLRDCSLAEISMPNTHVVMLRAGATAFSCTVPEWIQCDPVL